MLVYVLITNIDYGQFFDLTVVDSSDDFIEIDFAVILI